MFASPKHMLKKIKKKNQIKPKISQRTAHLRWNPSQVIGNDDDDGGGGDDDGNQLREINDKVKFRNIASAESLEGDAWEGLVWSNFDGLMN